LVNNEFSIFFIIHVAVGARERGLMAGVAVGGAVELVAMFAGPVTGASMNPTRSLALTLISGHLAQIWIYLTVPFVGVAAAVVPCRFLREDCG
jgi:aquaporin Z